MRIVSCENPKMIYSNELQQFVLVSCGKCTTCRNRRTYKWVNALDSESQCHKYTFFVTLTYNDESLPAYFYDEDMTGLVSNRDSLPRIPLHDLQGWLSDDRDKDYLLGRLVHPLGLPVICPKDLSNFFKRFNKYIYKNVTHHYSNFRYFAAWEYGPKTFRPHAHLLMWFDNDEIAVRFNEILSSSWSLGYFDGSAVYSNGGRSYVAKYCNKSLHLPQVYYFPKFASKVQFSKSPSIGSLPFLDEEVRDFFYRKPIERTIFNSRSGKFVTLPIEQSFKDRFFPKCPEYYRRSHFNRVTLYAATALIPSTTFQEFRSSLDSCLWLTSRNIANDDEKDLGAYYTKLKMNAKNEDSLKTSLYRLYSLSNRVCWFSHLLGISVDDYVIGIEEYHAKIDYANLKKMYQFQSDYAKFHPLSDLIHMYPDFAHFAENYCNNYLKNSDIDRSIPLYLAEALFSFGIFNPWDYKPLKDTFDYKSVFTLNEKLDLESSKRHEANAYIEGRLAVSDPSLSNILNLYNNA